jgi:hypothetical protein
MKYRYYFLTIISVVLFLILVYPVYGFMSDALKNWGGTDAEKSAIVAVAILGSIMITGFGILLSAIEDRSE